MSKLSWATIRVDDLQIFLKSKKLSLESGSIFSDSTTLPSDYRYHNSFSFLDTSNSCGSPLLIPSNLREESNANFLLNTDGTRPSLQFEQCFHTLINNRLRLYHNGEFSATEGTLVYYRNPKIYDLSTDGSFELKDDVMELIIDEAAKIISGDTGNMSGFQRNSQSVESNN